jgi:hypothetical protein
MRYILGFRKSKICQQEYRNYMTKIWAPEMQDLLIKYGVVL